VLKMKTIINLIATYLGFISSDRNNEDISCKMGSSDFIEYNDDGTISRYKCGNRGGGHG